MKLSIVSTMYYSAPYLEEFCSRLTANAVQTFGEDFEIVLVDDGSPDASLEVALSIAKRNKHIRVIELSRNFGHYKAIMTGLENSKGETVFLLDSDLEEQPEWLEIFNEKMLAGNADVVFGVQKTRKGKIFERVTGALFYKLFNFLSGVKIPENLVTARLMTRTYVRSLLLHKEREVFLAGLWQITGFEQVACVIDKKSKGNSTYTIRRRISLLLNSITSFSSLPLVFVFYMGVFIFVLSGASVLYLLFNWFFLSRPLMGWTSVIASIWLLGGIVISILGLIGLYMSKIFTETKKRPYTIVKKIYQD